MDSQSNFALWCCYAMQRPIHAIRVALGSEDARSVKKVTLRTPASTVQPLIHHRPRTGLEAKFSLEYAVAAVLLDGFPVLHSFTDHQVSRTRAVEIMESVSIEATPGGDGLLDGVCEITLHLHNGRADVPENRKSAGFTYVSAIGR